VTVGEEESVDGLKAWSHDDKTCCDDCDAHFSGSCRHRVDERICEHLSGLELRDDMFNLQVRSTCDAHALASVNIRTTLAAVSLCRSAMARTGC
jgi:hypothetical protein